MPKQPLLDSLLQQLLATDDPTEKAVIVAENAIAQLPAPVALVAQRCTILRWFDETIVTALLDESPPIERPAVIQTVVTTLTRLPFVERLAWGLVYHDQTRTGLLARTPPTILQHAAALALPAYNAHPNSSLAQVEALYCSVVSGQSDVATQLLDALLEEAGRQENWQAILTAFHALDEASALPFSVAIPRMATHHLFRGLAYHELGDLAGAIADYDQAIALEPDANAYYNQAINLHPEYALAYFNRGVARAAQGDYPKAIADFDHVIRLDPYNDLAYLYRGMAHAHASQPNYDAAITDYNEAIRLQPGRGMTYRYRGQARAAQGDYPKAIADYDRAIDYIISPYNAPAYNDRAIVHAMQGKHDKAMADFNKAIHLQPEYDAAYHNRGRMRVAQGDYAEAIDDYKQYLELGGGARHGNQEEVEQHIRILQAQLDGR